jgi:hypothetical protein
LYPSYTNIDVRNTVGCLVKHNLLSLTFSEFDRARYLQLARTRCLLRLSAPRYLAAARTRLGQAQAAVLEELYVSGSLMRHEIAPSVLSSNPQTNMNERDVTKVLEDLILGGWITGAQPSLDSATGIASSLNAGGG